MNRITNDDAIHKPASANSRTKHHQRASTKTNLGSLASPASSPSSSTSSTLSTNSSNYNPVNALNKPTASQTLAGLSMHPNFLPYNSSGFTSYPSSSSTSSSSSCSSYTSIDPSLLNHNFNHGPATVEQLNNLQTNLFLNQQFLNANLAGSVGQMSPAQIYQYHLLATSSAKMQQSQQHEQASKMLDWILKSSSQQQGTSNNNTQLNNFLLGSYHDFVSRQHQQQLAGSLRFQTPNSFQSTAGNTATTRRISNKKSPKVVPIEAKFSSKRKYDISPVITATGPTPLKESSAKKLKPLPETALLQKQEPTHPEHSAAKEEMNNSSITDETNNNSSTLSATSASSSTVKAKNYPCTQCGKVIHNNN